MKSPQREEMLHLFFTLRHSHSSYCQAVNTTDFGVQTWARCPAFGTWQLVTLGKLSNLLSFDFLLKKMKIIMNLISLGCSGIIWDNAVRAQYTDQSTSKKAASINELLSSLPTAEFRAQAGDPTCWTWNSGSSHQLGLSFLICKVGIIPGLTSYACCEFIRSNTQTRVWHTARPRNIGS